MINFQSINKAFNGLIGFREQNEKTLTTTQTSGVLIVNRIYKIKLFVAGDDFSNVADVLQGTINTINCIFQAIGTTPTTYSHLSQIEDVTLTYSSSGIYVNDIAGVSLQSIESGISRKNNLSLDISLISYLTEIYENSVKKVLNELITKAGQVFMTKRLEKTYDVFSNSPSKSIEQIGGAFVGILFKINNSDNLQIELQKLSIQFENLVDEQTLTFYLFSTEKKAALQTFDVTISENYNKIFNDIENAIFKYKTENSSHGVYILGYFEHNVEAPSVTQLAEGIKPLAIEPNENFMIGSHFQIVPIFVENKYISGETIDFTEFEIDYYSRGIDCRIAVSVDYTDFFVRNSLLIVDLLQYEIAKKILEDGQNSNEFNAITESNRKSWRERLLFINNLLNGYEFDDGQGNNGHKKGMYQEVLEKLEGCDNSIFVKRMKNFF